MQYHSQASRSGNTGSKETGSLPDETPKDGFHPPIPNGKLNRGLLRYGLGGMCPNTQVQPWRLHDDWLSRNQVKVINASQPGPQQWRAEYYGVVRATGIGVGQQALVRDAGLEIPIRIWTDSPAAMGPQPDKVLAS